MASDLKMDEQTKFDGCGLAPQKCGMTLMQRDQIVALGAHGQRVG